jgi:hypothetical protein
MHRRSDHGSPSASGPGALPLAQSTLPAHGSTSKRGEPRHNKGRWVAALAVAIAPLMIVSSACLDRPIGRPNPVTTNIFVDKITQTSVDKIDLLFMIDNSRSMSDKQAILQLAVPDLVNRLVNPICVDSMGNQFPPPDTGASCPAGQTQEFNPVRDINIGVVSSSLGDIGANDACPSQGNQGYNPEAIDLAHLMGSLERSPNTANTDQGFLAWRAATTNLGMFNRNFQQMVRDVGENGCGWEASLESWYRFLVDPYPYQKLVRVQCPGSSSAALNCVQQATDVDNRIVIDDVLMAQRAAFLRPDSLVAIIMLTDENDCSMQVGSQNWVVASIRNRDPMFRGSSRCDTDPNDKCCYSCPLGPPSGCQDDPICDGDDAAGVAPNRLADNQDGRNLRCYQQKRRFGVDFLYPTARYINALSQLNICWNRPDLSLDGCDSRSVVQNPLYAGGRLPNLVFFGGIIGVPWQEIASDVDANNRPIAAGQLRYQTAQELDANGTWAKILGSPGIAWRPAGDGRDEVASSPAIAPTVLQMVESEFPRNGIVEGNDENGRDYDTATGLAMGTPDDLEYSCIFPLRQAPPLPPLRDCAAIDPALACDCPPGDNDRPLCEENPGVSQPGTVQYWAKAYPGTRHLEVLKGYGENSIVASICAREVTDQDAADFGYRPAIAAIIDRLKEQLGDRCLPRSLTTASDGTVACSLVETIPQPENGACNCDPASARRDPDPVLDSVVRAQLAAERGSPCGPDTSCVNACLCEVLQVQQVPTNPPNALDVCRNDENPSGVEGWCYVDADQGLGNEALVENCPATQKRVLRFVGSGLGPNTTTFVACQGSSFAARE